MADRGSISSGSDPSLEGVPPALSPLPTEHIEHGPRSRFRSPMAIGAGVAGVAVLVFLALWLTGIAGGSSLPTEMDGQRALAQIVEEYQRYNSRSDVKVVAFHKTNGQSRENGGVKLYRMEYQAEMEFTKDCDVSSSFGWANYETFQRNETPGALTVKAGDRVINAGAIVLESTEKGWRLRPYDRHEFLPIQGKPLQQITFARKQPL